MTELGSEISHIDSCFIGISLDHVLQNLYV